MVMLSYQATWNAMAEIFRTEVRKEADAFPPQYFIARPESLLLDKSVGGG